MIAHEFLIGVPASRVNALEAHLSCFSGKIKIRRDPGVVELTRMFFYVTLEGDAKEFMAHLNYRNLLPPAQQWNVMWIKTNPA